MFCGSKWFVQIRNEFLFSLFCFVFFVLVHYLFIHFYLPFDKKHWSFKLRKEWKKMKISSFGSIIVSFEMRFASLYLRYLLIERLFFCSIIPLQLKWSSKLLIAFLWFAFIRINRTYETHYGVLSCRPLNWNWRSNKSRMFSYFFHFFL